MINGICEIVIAGLGVIIACLQLKLSKQINTQNISKEKGYFIIEETNIRNKDDTDYKRWIGLFDLRDALHFHLYGNGDVFLLKKIHPFSLDKSTMLAYVPFTFDAGSDKGMKLLLVQDQNNREKNEY